ncbi:CmcJ/NvfI family oxidoreductase [Sphingomonas oligophenolica]|uniref:CmcJ/NvfI family oxidoreductase n=1 Tax=Sphingomonas oligophenolica TaxID=301154 RepID=A0ABU9Y992_9SPHN
MIETRLNGQFPPDYVVGERINLTQLMNRGGETSPRTPPLNPPTRIIDARPLQAQAVSEREFFDSHGFVLLDAPTAMTDWADAAAVGQTYLPEVEALIRTRLYPGRKLAIMQPPNVLRRGAGTANPQYGTGVHQDYGTTADDFQQSVAAFAGVEAGAGWRARFEQPDVEGFVMLDFWRTTMAQPLKHMPLALCDPSSVDAGDIVPTALEGIAPGGAITHHVSLRYNAGQSWFYYPDMTANEVLVFKLFQLMPGEEPQRYRACFHSAVEDPATPPDAPLRQSCEHRVSVMLLRD